MRFSEAIEQMLHGKKIRCETWPPVTPDNAMYIDRDMTSITFETKQLYSLWEIYEDPELSFADVLKGLKEGKSYRRKSWPPPVDYIDCPEQYLRSVCGKNKHIASLCIEDFEATDWVQVR